MWSSSLSHSCGATAAQARSPPVSSGPRGSQEHLLSSIFECFSPSQHRWIFHFFWNMSQFWFLSFLQLLHRYRPGNTSTSSIVFYLTSLVFLQHVSICWWCVWPVKAAVFQGLAVAVVYFLILLEIIVNLTSAVQEHWKLRRKIPGAITGIFPFVQLVNYF